MMKNIPELISKTQAALDELAQAYQEQQGEAPEGMEGEGMEGEAPEGMLPEDEGALPPGETPKFATKGMRPKKAASFSEYF